ncbi:MAG: hypothetical protein COZ18_16050 [Flexibacter sp. CG_4_10_14_3_um_filter_32_15]|nr:MAG: hypothetical protein COZ18_16050 [Flexibacter sp. CG_4_10_14_3_um_filter_32_15]
MNSLSSHNPSVFFEDVEKLKQSFSFESEEAEKKFYKKNNYLFATTSASLFRLMPQIPYSKHKSIFEKLLFNLQLLNIEEKHAELFIENFEVIDIENSLDKAQKGNPFLFCCFHTGAYSLIPGVLTRQSLDFGFLSNKILTERKGEHFLETHRKYCEQHNIDSKTQLINVEESKGIWKALRMLKEGKSLIVYVDGNTGSNYSKKESNNTVKVDFLGEALRVRQGIAFLSYACNVPIVPILSSREYQDSELKLKRKYTLLPALYPTKFTDKKSQNASSKEEFAAQTMQKLYSILEKEVIKNGADAETIREWEGWIFVNKFFEELQKPILRANKKDSSAINSDSVDKKTASYIFNEERFALIETKKENEENQKNTLFDKFTYRFFPVSDLLYEIIIYFSTPKKLYLFDNTNEQVDKKTTTSSHSPISTNSVSESSIHFDSKLQLSKTLVSISALEKLIEKDILVQYK